MKSFHSFRLDTANHCLWRGEERLPIAPKAYDVLRYLVENPNRLVTQDDLLTALWPETYVNPEVLRKYILDIRKILGDRPEKPMFVETVPKRGYRFIAPVSDESATPNLPADEVRGSKPAFFKQQGLSGTRHWRTALLPLLALASVLVVTGATAANFWFARNKARARSHSNSSIVVLPFADLSPAKDEEYFSDGLTDELITDLAAIPGVKVVGHSSAFQFKGKNQDLRAVGKQLGVENVLEGSVRKDGSRVRITASLIKADDGFQLWSENYDREITHIFAAQDEIAGAVTQALQIKLLDTKNPGYSPASQSTNPEAYQAYLQGQYFVARGQDKKDLETALSYTAQATNLDPRYAPAWAQRSQVLASMAGVALIDNNDGFSRARDCAHRAIALDPKLAAGYLGLSMVQINHDWDWTGADASLKRAALLEPGSATVLYYQAYLARTLGRTKEAMELYKQAIALDPLRANLHLALAYELYFLDRYAEAKDALQKAQELNPQLSSLHLTRGKILFSEGRQQDAVAEMEKETGEWEKLSGQALAYAAAGHSQESDRALQKLIATHQNDSAYQIAEVYAYRGEVDKAFEWLDRSFQQRDPGTPELKTGPLMKSLRQDPRYAPLLKKMRLPAS